MPTGSERLVLAACDELAGHGSGFILASVIAGKTGMGPGAVQVCLRGLDRDGFIDLVPLDNGDLAASVTPKGRQELAKDEGDVRRPIPKPTEPSPIKVVPKGLKSFDKDEAELFIKLLPDYEGEAKLPNSIAFWKAGIEGRDADRGFRIGVIYGPSGSGKSSFVKAGLLPRLGDHITAIYLQSTAGETEARLLGGLRKRCPDLPESLRLAEALAALHDGNGLPQGKKILLILDQFEQLLVAWNGDRDAEWVSALQCCDGERVQALLLMRDEYLPATISLLEELGRDFKFDTDRNARRYDAFTRGHAREILVAYGRGSKQIQANPSPEQERFLKAALEGLQSYGRYLPVRLALFAQVFQERSWTRKELELVGGVEGIVVRFLEETFESQYADPRYRRHQKAVQSVLKALLPEGVTDIKGHKRSYGELLEVSEYAARPERFEDLISILDGELHLVTPTNTEGEDDGPPRPGESSYQLTHEFVVPSIQDWLTRRQQETRRGRAELRLSQLTARQNWMDNPFVPAGTMELLLIKWHTRHSVLNPNERRFLEDSFKPFSLAIAFSSKIQNIAIKSVFYAFHGVRIAIVLVVAAFTVLYIADRYLHFLPRK